MFDTRLDRDVPFDHCPIHSQGSEPGRRRIIVVAHTANDDLAPSKVRLPAAERRSQLLEAARITLSDQGYHRTTMSEIAAKADVTKPVLYQHFASKRDLYSAVLTSATDSLEQTVLTSLESATSTRDQVEFGIRAFVQFAIADPISFRLLFAGTVRQDDEWGDIARSVEATLFDGLALLIDVPSLSFDTRRSLAHGIIGMAEGMVRHWEHDGELSIEDLTQNIIGLAWAGLRSLAPRQR